MGPYFVSADRVGDPNNLKLETYVNGERRQSSNTSDMILGYPKKKQVWLKAGDEIASTIGKLGTLRFTLA